MNCDKAAVALLTFSPPDAKAWLYDLDQPDPTGGIMLCRKHANATVVPMSWQLLDERDPAWPGPAGSQPSVQAMAAATAEELLPSRDLADADLATANLGTTGLGTTDLGTTDLGITDLPSDTASIDEEFAALQADLPVTPQQYAEPQLVTARAAGRTVESDLMVDLGPKSGPDPSLFELPISDIPAVTPYAG